MIAMSNMLILVNFVLISSRAWLSEVQPLMRHLLFLLCLSYWHAIVCSRKISMCHLHIAVHAQIILLICKHWRGTTSKWWSCLFIFIRSCSRLSVCTHMSVRRISIVHPWISHCEMSLVCIESWVSSGLKLLNRGWIDQRMIVLAPIRQISFWLSLLLVKLSIKEHMPHFRALVPHSLLNKLSHCTHVKTLESCKINAELCISMLAKETAYFSKLIGNSDIKGLFMWLVPQDNTTRSHCNFFVVHCPANLSNVILICEEMLVRVTVTNRNERLWLPVLLRGRRLIGGKSAGRVS